MANNYKQTVSGTIGAGFKSVFSAQGKKYYILEHRVNSAYHKAGEMQEIIVDQIELGRDPRCQVRFDESFATVSRRHAAIVRSGEGWKLVQLSSTNKTLLNGTPIDKEWYLQNGDEIQLSVNGPKIGFIIPQGNKSTVNTIGLSRRLSLFRQQALRPYKTAITLLAILLVLAIAAGTFFIVRGNNINRELRREMVSDSIAFQQKLESMSGTLSSVTKDYNSLKDKIKHIQGGQEITPVKPEYVAGASYADYVYYIRTTGYTIELNGEVNKFTVGDQFEWEDGRTITVDGWIGTGFLLSNGKLVTARHCIEAWFYDVANSSTWQLLLNIYASQGAKVSALFVAVSATGQELHFSSNDVMCRRSGDHPVTVEDDVVVTMAGNQTFDPLDYAWFDTGLSGGLAYDQTLSDNLALKTSLEIYGFPHGWGVHGKKDVTPIMGSGIVAREGLENGMILVGEASFESGHSGSPVLYKDEQGNYTVVGIVSAKSQHYGFVVPISRIR